MPHGYKRVVTIDRPAEIERKARAIMAKGFIFEIEMLRTGQVSMEIIKREPADSEVDDYLLAGEICHDGPTNGESLGVPESVDKMIVEAYEELEGKHEEGKQNGHLPEGKSH